MPTQSSTPKRGKHIQYTGIDGAGKSTQAGKLTYYLLKKYGPTYLAESRTDFISKLMHTLAWQHGRTDRRTYYGDHVVDFAKAFDVIRNHNTEIEPLLAAGMHVVEPRSIYCRTAMALAMTGKRDEKTEQLLELIPKPNLLVWIDTDLRMGRPRYEIADARDHHHVVCVRCERIEDFIGCDSDHLADKALKQVKGFSHITGHSLEFFGLCNSCVKQGPTLQAA